MKKLTHPADGLYTFSAARAKELCACNGHFEMWIERHGEAEVPVTLDDMAKQEDLKDPRRVGSSAIWCMEKMRKHGLISRREFVDAKHQWLESYVGGAAGSAKALMDVLLVRAKREGRIA